MIVENESGNPQKKDKNDIDLKKKYITKSKLSQIKGVNKNTDAISLLTHICSTCFQNPTKLHLAQPR